MTIERSRQGEMAEEGKKVVLLNLSAKDIVDVPGMVAPFSAVVLATTLTEEHNVEIIDLDKDGKSKKRLRNADHVFFTGVPSSLYSQAVQVREGIKQDVQNDGKTAPIMSIGGPHASYFKGDLDGWDHISVGDGFESAKLIVGGKAERVVEEVPLADEKFHKLQPWAYSLLKHPTSYGRPGTDSTLPFMSGIGCCRECAFCANHPRRIRRFTPEQIEQTLGNITDLGVQQSVDYNDDLLQPERNTEWKSQYIEILGGENIKIRHSAHVKSILHKSVKEDNILNRLTDAGAVGISVGIDGPLVGDGRWLKYFDKRASEDECLEALRRAKAAGYYVKAYQIFPPNGGIAAGQAIMRLANLNYVDKTVVSSLALLPGSPMYENPEIYGLKPNNLVYDAAGHEGNSSSVYFGKKKGISPDMSIYTPIDRLVMMYVNLYLKNLEHRKEPMPI